MSHSYLMHYNGKGRLLDTQPANWKHVQEQFLADAGGPKHKHDWPDTIALWYYDGRVPYDEYLVSAAGAGFTVIRLPTLSDDEVNATAAKIRRDRDVVSLRFLHVKELI